MMLVKTTNHPKRNTAARDTFCVHLSCSLQIACIGIMMMMRSHIVLNAAYAYQDAPRLKQLPGIRLSQTLCMGLHSNTEAMANAKDPTNIMPARTCANLFRFHWTNIRRYRKMMASFVKATRNLYTIWQPYQNCRIF